jgi:hypothetical protein
MHIDQIEFRVFDPIIRNVVHICLYYGASFVRIAVVVKAMTRSFNEWWSAIPTDSKEKARKGDEAQKPLLNQVYKDRQHSND